MRILIVNNFARITGGADLHCLELAEGLRERGHEVAFLATRDPNNQETQGAFVSLSVSNATRSAVTGASAMQVAARSLWNREAAKATDVLVTRFKPDVVHLHKLYVQLSVAPVVIAGRHGIPLVQTVHDYEFTAAATTDATCGWIDRVEPQARYRLLNTLLYATKRLAHRPRVTEWIAVSRSTAAVYEASGITASVLPNFTLAVSDSGKLPDFDRRHGVLYFGRLSEEKGLADVLAMATATPELEFKIAGQGPLQELVESAAASSPNIRYLGSLSPSDVIDQLRAARIVVMPSRWQEPGPLASLEAMAQGVPVVAYANGGLAEYVGDARAGLVIRESASELTRAVTSLYHDRERWQELSDAGPVAVAERHSRGRYLDALERLYAQAVAGGHASST